MDSTYFGDDEFGDLIFILVIIVVVLFFLTRKVFFFGTSLGLGYGSEPYGGKASCRYCLCRGDAAERKEVYLIVINRDY